VKHEEIVRLGKQLDDSSTHIQIFCVPVFRSLDAFEPGLNVRGHTRRRNIIIEDIGTKWTDENDSDEILTDYRLPSCQRQQVAIRMLHNLFTLRLLQD
jgi:hypothetical protein